MIIDDPVKNREQAESEVYRSKVWDEWESTLKTRLHPGAAVILILTRWHYDDLAGRLLNPDFGPVDGWQQVNLPLLSESADDLLNRPMGAPLWPEHGFDAAWAHKLKAETSSKVFASLYQQRPVPDDGNIFKSEWWQYYNRLPEQDDIFMIQSWDTGYKADDLKSKSKHSYSCGQTWAETKQGYFMVDRYCRKVEYPDLKRAVVTEYNKHRPHAVLIEDKASGQSIAQELKRETTIPIISVPVTGGDKVMRATLISPQMESRKVFLPARAPWLNEYKGNMEAFPNGEQTDDTDATTQALDYFLKRKGSTISGARIINAKAQR
jgi:predicted phage terminase large subunit-like protein